MTADSDKAMANTYQEWFDAVDRRKRERNAAALLQERKAQYAKIPKFLRLFHKRPK